MKRRQHSKIAKAYYRLAVQAVVKKARLTLSKNLVVNKLLIGLQLSPDFYRAPTKAIVWEGMTRLGANMRCPTLEF